MINPVLDLLASRASAPIHELTEPAPDDAQIGELVKLASRVPDHGRLAPWRFIIYRGDARRQIGEQLAAIAEKKEGPLSDARRAQELARFSRAPLVIGVIGIVRDNPKIPQWEMLLSGGAAAMTLVIAANAMGYRTNWITNWYSEDAEARAMLGLSPKERVIGFVHIGTHTGDILPRPRPDPAALYSDYNGPWVEPVKRDTR